MVAAAGASLARAPQLAHSSSSSSSSTWCRTRRLQIAACHRCLQRQLVHRLPPPACRGRGLAAATPPRPGLEAAAAEQEESKQQAVPAAALEKGGSSSGEGGEPGTQQQVQQPPAAAAAEQQQVDTPGVRAAIAILKFYKGSISPLIPPACRFLPTCSVYSMEAFQRYGVGKGFVLTAWRLFRCSPWGNSGYDPVRWPPPGLERLFPADT